MSAQPVAVVAAPAHAVTVQGRPAPSPKPPLNPYNRPKAVLGDPTALACTVAKDALEVALGMDGIAKLNRWVTAEIRAQVAKQQSLSRRAGYVTRGAVGIQRVRVYRVSSRAAEVSVIAREGDRLRPIAMRLEDVAGKWLTTALELG